MLCFVVFFCNSSSILDPRFFLGSVSDGISIESIIRTTFWQHSWWQPWSSPCTFQRPARGLLCHGTILLFFAWDPSAGGLRGTLIAHKVYSMLSANSFCMIFVVCRWWTCLGLVCGMFGTRQARRKLLSSMSSVWCAPLADRWNIWVTQPWS